MKRPPKSPPTRGSAYIATLVMFTIMVSMVTIALRANGVRRTDLRLQADAERAFSLAESGLAEAVQALTAKVEAGTLEGKIAHGVFSAAWTPLGDDGTFRVVAQGTVPTRLPAPMRKTVTAVVNVSSKHHDRPAAVQILSWSSR